MAQNLADALFYEHEVHGEVAITALTGSIEKEAWLDVVCLFPGLDVECITSFAVMVFCRQCKNMFDPHDYQRLNRERMREAVVKAYHERKHLALSLEDLESMCVG